MAYSGPFAYGDRVQLTDAKRRHYTVIPVSYTHLTLPTICSV